MAKYLIDVNLPRHITLWESEEFIHQIDINDEWSDQEIWKYVKERSLTIVSKDSDFSNRMMSVPPPPRVIHFRIGNMRLRQFISFISLRWDKIRSCLINTSLLRFTLIELKQFNRGSANI